MKRVIQGLILWVLGIGAVEYARTAPVYGGPDDAIHPFVFLAVAIVGILWVIRAWTKRISFFEVMVAFLIGGALVWLNGTSYMPLIDNPCPHLDMGVYVNGECHGLDTQENWDRWGVGE